MKKSINPDKVEDAGIANLGKYTLVNRFELPIKQFPEYETAPEKYVHGTRATYENIGYGMPSLGILANFPKKVVKTSMVNNGWMMAHNAPNTVCLYFILISRHTKK
jgi:hypothetical protein